VKAMGDQSGLYSKTAVVFILGSLSQVSGGGIVRRGGGSLWWWDEGGVSCAEWDFELIDPEAGEIWSRSPFVIGLGSLFRPEEVLYFRRLDEGEGRHP
jgi:hypothetical protein